MTEKMTVTREMVPAGKQFLFTAYRDCVVDLMITAPNTRDVKTIIIVIDGMTCEMSLLNGTLCTLKGTKLQHMNEISIHHGSLNPGQPFCVRLVEVGL